MCSNVAFPWATIVAITSLAGVVTCSDTSNQVHVPSVSLRASAVTLHSKLPTAASEHPLLWQRPSLERPTMVNGSIVMQTLNVSGFEACNSVCGSTMDFALIADISGSVGENGVAKTQIFLARLLTRLRLGQEDGHQLAGLTEAGMKARLLTDPPLVDKQNDFMGAISKLKFREDPAMNLVEAMGMASNSFMYGRQHARSLVLAIVDGPGLRQRLIVQMAEKISVSADLVVILVADRFNVAAQRAVTEWLQAAHSCTPYGCRLLQIDNYDALANVDTTGVLAEICPDLV